MSERSSIPSAPRKRPKPLAIDVRVPAQALSYPVVVGCCVLSRLGEELRQRHGSASRVAVISDDHVFPLHGEAAIRSLEAQGFAVTPVVVPAGEASKQVAVLVDVVDQLLKAGLGRRDAVVALGGGVIGDLAGLAAALFMRGIPVIQCPTSLLAQVDASVGGKVAVDLAAGKNLLGAFHFPLAVLIDPELLATLDDRQLASGLAEMLKHGALFSAEHFQHLVDAADAFFGRDYDVIAPLIATSVGLKAACVGRDPWEQSDAGKGRVLLNFGHTLGHAIEAASNYELAHGEAVALGMLASARVARAKGIAGADLEVTLRDAFARLRLPTDLDVWLSGERGAAVERMLGQDKKRSGGQLSFVVIARLGEPSVLSLHVRELLALARRSG
ncbi:MAG: 3-dehydroquinate synthase [Myxococcales bacterium]|nr:3-dehydroquinate synthase [Myxococcales bacterium]MCB9700675.1 3-dehydroquinate synthase [Myxococcales bacterium]